MSDFVISKKKEIASNVKTVSFKQIGIKRFILALKGSAFFVSFLALIYLSMSNNNLMLKEISVVGGILMLVFFMHCVSNR